MKRLIVGVVVGVVLGIGGPVDAAIDIDTVAVGNPFNTDDTQGDGYGGVDYVYNIGKYEVSNAEYTEFLNAVDADGSDPHDLYNGSKSSSWLSKWRRLT